MGFPSGFSHVYQYHPLIFYAIVTLVMVFLFAMGWIPKVGPMKKAYARTKATVRTYSEESWKYNLELEDPGKRWKIACDFAAACLTADRGDRRGGRYPGGCHPDIGLLPGFVCSPGRMTFSKWSELLISGFCEMMPTLAILAGAFAVARCCNMMQLPEYIISTVQPFVTPQTYPLIIFLVVSVLTFATSSTWGISTIVIPIIIPLGAAVGANMILTMAAILSGSAFGSHACFYSDATVLASAGARIDNMEHAFTQMPYAFIGAALTCVCLLVSGFVMHV